MEILYYLFKSSLLLGLFLVVYRYFLSGETFYRFNRWFLLGGIVASFVLPFCILTQKVYVSPGQTFNLANLAGVSQTLPEAERLNYFTWWNMLLALYVVGLIAALVYFTVQLISIYHFLKKHSYTVRNGLKHIETNQETPPFSFLKYIVYNPGLHNSAELEIILKHEETHANQLHSLDLMLGKFVSAVSWFNPLAWWYSRLIEQNLELIADGQASHAFTLKNYQMALVKQVTNHPAPHLSQSFYKSFLKKRILMLNTQPSLAANRYKAIIVVPFLALFLYSFNLREETVYQNNERVDINSKDNQAAENGQQSTFRYEIQPDATVTQMEDLADELEQTHRVRFTFSNLVRDDSKRITQVSLKLKDLRNKNISELNLNNTEGVGKVIVFRDEKGIMGFSSRTSSSVVENRNTTKNTPNSINGTGIIRTHEGTFLDEEREALRQEREDLVRQREALRKQRDTLRSERERLESQRVATRQMLRGGNDTLTQADYLKRHNKTVKESLKQKGNLLRKRSTDSLNNQQHAGLSDEEYNLSDQNILYIVDGVSMDELDYKIEELDPENIKSIEIIKNENMQVFGEKARGKEAVILISTKNKNEINNP